MDFNAEISDFAGIPQLVIGMHINSVETANITIDAEPSMPDPSMTEVFGSHAPRSIVGPRTARRVTVVALMVAAQVGGMGLAVGVAAPAGLTAAITVSIDGATGQWTPANPSTAVPATPVSAVPTPAPTASTPEQAGVPTTLAAPGTVTPTATGTPPVDELSSTNEPEPTTRP